MRIMSNRTESHLAAERLESMRRLLRDRRIVSVGDLCRALRVSSATVRRDLVTLEDNGTVRRVHGGAVYCEKALEEPLFEDKTTRASNEKRRIAGAAAALIHTGDSVLLDGGSTVLALALTLRTRADLTIVTNSLRIAAELAGGGPRLILVGGELRRLSQTFVGPLTHCLLAEIQADITFLGTTGITPEGGMTTTDPNEAFTKNAMIARSRRTVLLSDSSKIGRVSFARFGCLSDIHTLITDRKIAAASARAFRKQGLKIIAA